MLFPHSTVSTTLHLTTMSWFPCVQSACLLAFSLSLSTSSLKRSISWLLTTKRRWRKLGNEAKQASDPYLQVVCVWTGSVMWKCSLPKIHLLLVRPVLKTTLPLITHRQLFMLNWICSLKSDPAQIVWRCHLYKLLNQKPCILVAQHASIWHLCMDPIDNKTPILILPWCTMIICQANLACPCYCTTHIPLALLITCHTLIHTC